MERIYWNIFGREVAGHLVEVVNDTYHIVLDGSFYIFKLSAFEFNRFCRFED